MAPLGTGLGTVSLDIKITGRGTNLPGSTWSHPPKPEEKTRNFNELLS